MFGKVCPRFCRDVHGVFHVHGSSFYASPRDPEASGCPRTCGHACASIPAHPPDARAHQTLHEGRRSSEPAFCPMCGHRLLAVSSTVAHMHVRTSGYARPWHDVPQAVVKALLQVPGLEICLSVQHQAAHADSANRRSIAASMVTTTLTSRLSLCSFSHQPHALAGQFVSESRLACMLGAPARCPARQAWSGLACIVSTNVLVEPCLSLPCLNYFK